MNILQKQAKKRKWSRFKVKQPLRAKIVGGQDRSQQLTSLSLGGCAFISDRRDARFLKQPEVKLEFEVQGEKYQVSGRVQYFQFMPQSGSDANLMGIEFEWPDFESRQAFGMFLGKAVSEGSLEHQ